MIMHDFDDIYMTGAQLWHNFGTTLAWLGYDLLRLTQDYYQIAMRQLQDRHLNGTQHVQDQLRNYNTVKQLLYD